MRFWGAFGAVLAVGIIALAAPATVVYGNGEVRLLGDTDSHYHRGSALANIPDDAVENGRSIEVSLR